MKLLLFVFLALASAGPLERLVQKVATPSLSLLQRCIDGKPTFLETADLPGSNRESGDPCAADSQCRSGLKCTCQDHGGKECSAQCVVQGVLIPADGEFHDVHCFARCQCLEGLVGCVDMCPLVVIDCPAGQHSITIPPAEGQCCSTLACEPNPSDCATQDVTAILTFPSPAVIQSYGNGTAQVDVALAASCCTSPENPCGTKTYTAPYPWVISRENYLKASGYASIASIPALGLSISAPSNFNTQPTPVKLGSDVTTVTVKGGGYCGEGRVTADLNGDQGTYGPVHNGVRFDELSLSLAACTALCDTFPTCSGVSWKPERGLHLDGNCILRGQVCAANAMVVSEFTFYPKTGAR
jgi:hypothetical protein